MEIESLEILDYVSNIPPLDTLHDDVISDLVQSMEIKFIRKNTVIIDPQAKNHYLYLIRTGAVEINDLMGNLLGRPAEGEWFGQRSLLDNGVVNETVTTLENCLLYLIPEKVFRTLQASSVAVQQYFHSHKPERIRKAIGHLQETENTSLIALQVKDLIHGVPVSIEQSDTIANAAQLMTENTVTAMLVNDHGKLSGIITDRAFCTKVVVKNIAYDQPVSQIMTANPITISENTQASAALLLMARHNIRHIPVMQDGQVTGMVTATDLIRIQSSNAIYLINEINRATHVDELASLSVQLPKTLVSLVESSMTAYDIGQAISSIGHAITQRLLHLAEKKFGKPPVSYSWICAGSMARGDQTAHSDQDNAIIISDNYHPEQHQQYFQELTRYVCDGLNGCGYVYCPGDVMANNPKWCQPLHVWKSYFDQWIECPEPKALMLSSIFFDLRHLHGDSELFSRLRKHTAEKSQNNSLFLSLMSENALHYQPPLGFFRNFVLEKGGGHGKTLDMKKKGVVPIIDLARVYALKVGVRRINTKERLFAAMEKGAISEEGMKDLQDAYEFISSVRLQHQAKQIKQGFEADNYVSPDVLSSLERRHLKDAFEVVTVLQKVMNNNFLM